MSKKFYTTPRPLDVFTQTRGLVIENDEKWQFMRSKVLNEVMQC